MENIIEMRNIHKSFGGVKANEGVDFTLRKGEIHSLLGENGAGKTTLMNILYGLYQADEGEILLRGKPVHIGDPLKAIEHGIGMVHQHFMLVDPYTVYENITLGSEETRHGLLVQNKSRRAIEKLIAGCGLHVDLDAKIHALPIGAKQRVEILKVLYKGANILILDEPTAVLTPQETDEMFVILNQLRANGTSIIIITHKLRETFAIADRVTVMRKGRVVASMQTKEVTQEQLAVCMVGRDVHTGAFSRSQNVGDELLKLENVSTNQTDVKNLKNVSISLKKGQIYGIAGVDGNGQSQLVNVLVGVTRPSEGRVLLDGADITPDPPRKRIHDGIAVIPEDRNTMGLVPNFNVTENILLGRQWDADRQSRGILKWQALTAQAKDLMDEYDINPRRADYLSRSFSGGNQQKIVVARELSHSGVRVVVAVQPTRGLDIGAIEFVHGQLLKMRDKGAAVLLVSTELDEVRNLSDTIAVLYDGTLMQEGPSDSFTEQDLGLLMAGHGTQPQEAVQ